MQTFSLADPPDQPQISGDLEELRARRALRLVCSAFRGNPLADLTWYKNDEVSQYKAVYHKTYQLLDWPFARVFIEPFTQNKQLLTGKKVRILAQAIIDNFFIAYG